MTLSARGALGAVVLVPRSCRPHRLWRIDFNHRARHPGVERKHTGDDVSRSSDVDVDSRTAEHRQLTSNELVKTLLGLDDMPAGFTADKPDLKDQNVTFCRYKQPNRENGYAMITFEQGSTSAIGNTLRQYDSAADASAQQDALAKAV